MDAAGARGLQAENLTAASAQQCSTVTFAPQSQKSINSTTYDFGLTRWRHGTLYALICAEISEVAGGLESDVGHERSGRI